MLSLTGITKHYGSTVALSDVSIEFGLGEVHAVLGENGAGKSTLMKIAFGLVQPESGTIEFAGKARSFRSPADARHAGIGMVHQHFTSIDSLTVAENIALAADWPVAPRQLQLRARALSEKLGLPLDPTLLAGSLSAGLKQRLELLRALAGDARVVLLDEPTSVLAPPEAEALLAVIRGLRARGIAVVLITHKLDEALAIADRVTVLRRGRVMLIGQGAELNRELIVRAMIGEDTDSRNTDYTDLKDDYTDAESVQSSVQSVQSVSSLGLKVNPVGETGPGLRSASFELRVGEVVGVAAVEGSGQRELFRAIAGLVSPSAGTLTVTGKVAFVPEDRTVEGTVQEFTLTENVALVQGASASWVRGPWIDWDAAAGRTEELVGEFDVRVPRRAESPSSAGVGMASLSGGNQQKMVLAAALERRPAVLLAENPTRGLDIKASADVTRRLRDAAQQGVSVLVHLPDLDELLALVDRVVVLNNGVLTTMPAGADRSAIGAAMVSTAGS